MAPLTPVLETRLELPTQSVFYRLYRPHAPSGRRLLLLHGGGVAGALTWEGILPHLRHWPEIVVPDLRGSGDTYYPDGLDHPFEAEDVVDDLAALRQHLGWHAFDLGGYSYGGLIAMLLKTRLGADVEKTYLFEPALLGRIKQEDGMASRERMLLAAHLLRQETQAGLDVFLDVVAPGRTRGSKNEALVRSRLSQRPAGLAYAVECVSHAGAGIDRDELVARQADVSSFIGGRSSPELDRLCRRIAAGRSDWSCHLIAGADHALPFQKPEQIGRIMNEEMERYLTRT
ncbi:MAG: alpha/beta hydrolase [Sulfuricellaceae bacterium]|nr:alpha/beta hydrolase [Sulfuricellaceae bacterium]